MGIMEKVPVKFFTRNFFLSSSGYSQPPQGTYLIRLNRVTVQYMIVLQKCCHK